MPGRIRAITGHVRAPLTTGWEVCRTAPGAVRFPDELLDTSTTWIPASAPGTAADALRAAGLWSLDGPPLRFDAFDWWYRARFRVDSLAEHADARLAFDGLATLAEVWLNGAPLFASDNMFLAAEVAVGTRLRVDNELLIRFAALDRELATKRPRPRWRTPMLENQQLRWVRTTLLGRTPGWSPPAAAVGPWRGVFLVRPGPVGVTVHRLTARVEGDTGVLELSVALDGQIAAMKRHVQLRLDKGSETVTADLAADPANPGLFAGWLPVPRAALWWPHTHGEPALYTGSLRIFGAEQSDAVEVDLGPIGFRRLEVRTERDSFAMIVNGKPVFCRGVCWTPLDPVTLTGSAADYRRALTQLRDAGMNCVRVGGTMVYESDEFLDLCDELGLLVWQDFMFANMDYPDADSSFAASVASEAQQALERLQAHPCLAVLCGNSEVEQQAAMWGATRQHWSPHLFHETLPALARTICPTVAYWPSSAHGGAFPHQADAGTTSYFGVGAYMRPLEDARRAAVCFASECLAFANVPEPSGIARMPGGGALRVHHPAWKARVPRDLGAGWDFDDVRDHYLQQVFRVDPLALRRSDHDRYLALSRVVTGEVMASVFADWRRPTSSCHGGLIWFYRDLWAGAGWGIVDDAGQPKAPYYYLRRMLQPLAVALSDEGVNGVSAHLFNDGLEPFAGTLEFALFRAGEIAVASARLAIELGAHSARSYPVAAAFDLLTDLSYAYRFGPAPLDLIEARLTDAAGATRAVAMHFPIGLPSGQDHDLGLGVAAAPSPAGDVELTIGTRRFAQSVHVDAPGYAPDDNYFHLAPGRAYAVVLRPQGAVRSPARVTVTALNGESSVRATWPT